MVLCLADRDVHCHSAVLRARSPFFRAFFDEDAWTVNRWERGHGERGEGVVVRVLLRHMSWRPVEYVVRYMYGGDVEMFDVLGAYLISATQWRCTMADRTACVP